MGCLFSQSLMQIIYLPQHTPNIQILNNMIQGDGMPREKETSRFKDAVNPFNPHLVTTHNTRNHGLGGIGSSGTTPIDCLLCLPLGVMVIQLTLSTCNIKSTVNIIFSFSFLSKFFKTHGNSHISLPKFPTHMTTFSRSKHE